MQFLKNFKKKKTISIIAGKCFLTPRLTLGSFLALGLPLSSKKKPRVSLCARKLIFLPMIVIAIPQDVAHEPNEKKVVLKLKCNMISCSYVLNGNPLYDKVVLIFFRRLS